MKALDSKLTGMEMDYATLSDALESQQFTLGGNWDYHQGCFDRALDGEKQTVWLRIPFSAPNGQFDPETAKQVTRVIVGKPFVLNHQYHEGDDGLAQSNIAGGLVNQFQSPTDPDGPINGRNKQKAEEILRELENLF